ncbi:MAG: YggT family protein [Alphaproteobacteria bacterium]|nr:YggT family protein [Alphaproteobacteria bacterium]
MSLVGFVFIVCALIVLFDMVVSLFKKYKMFDFSKNEIMQKTVDFVSKLTSPVYEKVTEVLPEKFRTVLGFNIVPLLIFIVLAVLGQWMF